MERGWRAWCRAPGLRLTGFSVAPFVYLPRMERSTDPHANANAGHHVECRDSRRSAEPPSHRPCAWCALEFPVVRRPGRPRLYCNHACRQRAYEHRHGFRHRRTVRPLPGQAEGDVWRGTGYERGAYAFARGKAHALRTSVRPEGPRRETLCGLLAVPVSGQWFTANDPRACKVCALVAAANPLRYGVSPSNELSRLRALIDEVHEARIDPSAAFAWIRANGPTTGDPAYSTGASRVTGTKTRSR